jgi:rRNA maturation endonuclease Nob1
MVKPKPIKVIKCQSCARNFSAGFNMCPTCGWTTEDNCAQVYKPINGSNNKFDWI